MQNEFKSLKLSIKHPEDLFSGIVQYQQIKFSPHFY